MKDRRIKATPKAAPPLNIPYFSPNKKLAKGVSMLVSMIHKQPTVGKFPGARGSSKKASKPRQNR